MNYTKFLKMITVVANHHKRIAEKIRERFSYEDLMTTEAGNPRKIICTTSHKFDMKDGRKVKTIGVYLSPADEVTQLYPEYKINMCPNSGMCDRLCLTTSGKMALTRNEKVRIHKTLAFIAYPERFLNQLLHEVTDEARRAKKRGEIIHCRFNGTSDIAWERMIHMDLFAAVTPGFDSFYDYTKLGRLRLRRRPESYHLTFSIDEKDNALSNARHYLEAGLSVAVVLHEKDKNTILNLKGVIDGDLNDHRPLDPPGSIVVLKSKGKLRKSPVGLFVKSPDFVRELVALKCSA
jgi:hypothetical protein